MLPLHPAARRPRTPFNAGVSGYGSVSAFCPAAAGPAGMTSGCVWTAVETMTSLHGSPARNGPLFVCTVVFGFVVDREMRCPILLPTSWLEFMKGPVTSCKRDLGIAAAFI